MMYVHVYTTVSSDYKTYIRPLQMRLWLPIHLLHFPPIYCTYYWSYDLLCAVPCVTVAHILSNSKLSGYISSVLWPSLVDKHHDT